MAILELEKGETKKKKKETTKESTGTGTMDGGERKTDPKKTKPDRKGNKPARKRDPLVSIDLSMEFAEENAKKKKGTAPKTPVVKVADPAAVGGKKPATAGEEKSERVSQMDRPNKTQEETPLPAAVTQTAGTPSVAATTKDGDINGGKEAPPKNAEAIVMATETQATVGGGETTVDPEEKTASDRKWSIIIGGKTLSGYREVSEKGGQEKGGQEKGGQEKGGQEKGGQEKGGQEKAAAAEGKKKKKKEEKSQDSTKGSKIMKVKPEKQPKSDDTKRKKPKQEKSKNKSKVKRLKTDKTKESEEGSGERKADKSDDSKKKVKPKSKARAKKK